MDKPGRLRYTACVDEEKLRQKLNILAESIGLTILAIEISCPEGKETMYKALRKAREFIELIPKLDSTSDTEQANKGEIDGQK